MNKVPWIPDSRIVGHNGIQWDIIMFPLYGPTGSSPNVPSGRGRTATLWGLLSDEHETDEYERLVRAGPIEPSDICRLTLKPIKEPGADTRGPTDPR